MVMVSTEMQCGPKCRSRQHASQLINAVTRGNLRQIQIFLSQCFNAASNTDIYGRNVLHIAATCGKWEVVAWLLNDCGANLNVKDHESGWTALHRAIFHGQLMSARLLISYGANVQSRDKEGLTALDIAMKDRLPHVEFVLTGLNEVYTWGDNTNFTLGHENEQRKKQPEPVELFRKQAISIKQVVMSKYHTVFLSTSGQVYTCGHGRGGRLGHGSEQTCLKPKQIMINDEVCKQVSASRDHTVLLMESGAIYTCGYSECFHLGSSGHASSVSLSPKLLINKVLKSNQFSGVLVRRYHMVLYNDKAIFTFGQNAGQLGHHRNSNDSNISQPRQVSALMHEDIQLKIVAASDAATIVVTNKGDVYALHEYQCRRIISKRLDIEQLCVHGGNLDHHSGMDTLKEHGGSVLTVAIRTALGKIYIWRANDPVLKRCAWVLRRSLYITDMSLNQSNLAFITKEGEAFIATLPKKKIRERTVSSKEILATAPSDNFSISITDLIKRDEAEEVSVERVPLVHRAICITTDSKGRNMAILQAQPNANLTEIPGVQGSTKMTSDFELLMQEADTMDTIHDVVLQVGNAEIPSHKYILASRSEYFRKIFIDESDQENQSPWEKPVISLDDVNFEIFQQLLLFIYTDKCDLLTVGKAFTFHNKNTTKESVQLDSPELCFEEDPRPINDHKVSAFAVHQAKNSTKKGKKKGKSEEKDSSQSKTKKDKSPIAILQEMAKKFGVKDLARRLDAVQYVNGAVVKVPGKKIQQPNLKFQKNKFHKLYDVCIAAEDGRIIECHKCVLVARLEYFKSMLGSGWVETSNTKALSLPVPGDILHNIIVHLYVDDCPVLRECQDVEFLCNVLVMADQLLIEKLKQMCEVTIAGLVTLRNVCELLEFSSMYNATQLKVTCQQYVTINIAVLLETKALDVLSDEVMEELTDYYKDTIPGMDRRRLTPYDGWPDMAHLEQLEAELGESDLTGTPGLVLPSQGDHTAKKNKGKKKRSRTKSSGEDATDKKADNSPRSEGQSRANRQMSECSDTSFTLELDNIDESCSEVTVDKRDKSNPWTTIKVSVPKTLPKRPDEILSHANGGISNESPCITDPVLKGAGIISHVKTETHGTDETINQTAKPSQISKSPGQTGMLSSPVGLRSIMAEQAADARSSQKPRNTGGSGKKTGRLTHKDWKKLDSLDTRETSTNAKQTGKPTSPDTGGPITGEGAKPKTWSSPSNAWGSPSNVVSSFKDLMLTDETERTYREHQRSQNALPSTTNAISPQNKTISWGIQTPNPRKPKPTTPVSPNPPQEGASSPGVADNPWQMKVKATPPAPCQALSFSDIMQDEIQQKKTLDRATSKPLALIQIEEQAICELLQHYRARESLDECITVERVQETLATPMWAATQRNREP